jgi:sulfatase maturation enzyme AslB (radical SAM superfamily)
MVIHPSPFEAARERGPSATSTRISRARWLAYGPFLAQVVVTRRCNLSCGYCFEFDKVSAPFPTHCSRRASRSFASSEHGPCV